MKISQNAEYQLNPIRDSLYDGTTNRVIRGLTSEFFSNNAWKLESGEAHIYSFENGKAKLNKIIIENSPVVSADPVIADNPLGTYHIYSYLNFDRRIVQTVETPTSSQLRDKIYINRLTIVGGTLAKVESLILTDSSYTKEILDNGWTKNISVRLNAVPGNRDEGIEIIGGRILIAGLNVLKKNNPHSLIITDQPSPVSWREYDPIGNFLGTTNSFDFGRYYTSNGITSFTGNDASVQTMYLDKDGQLHLFLGTVRYGSLNQAIQRWQYNERPLKFKDKVLIAIIMGRTDYSSITNSNFVKIRNTNTTEPQIFI